MPAPGAAGGITLVLTDPSKPPCEVLQTLSQLLPPLCCLYRCPQRNRTAWGRRGAAGGHPAIVRPQERGCSSRPGPRRQRRGGSSYSWKPGGEVMLPECCNLRPVVLGEEPGFSEGRLQVGKLLGASGKKGFLKEERARSSWFLVQTPAKGWELK